MNEAPVLQARSLAKSYGPLRALRGLDLELRRGEIFGYLGPNGAGKTTTIRLILGFLRPSAGVAHVAGHDCWADSVSVRRRTGYLPGEIRLYPRRDGRGFLQLMARLRGGDQAALARRYEELAERLELDLGKRVRAYSKGNRQKLGIVQALMHEPELLVLDEPTSALDPLIQQQVYGILREARDRGSTIFFSSHILSEVEKLCDRVAIIRAGELLELRSVALLDELQLRRVTASFTSGPDADSAAIAAQAELEEAGFVVQREGEVLELTVRGEIDRLVKTLARHTVDQLSVEPLTLEEVFFEHYRGELAGERAR